MVCKIKCAAITGIDTQPVIVETDICNGLPSFDMVGLLASNIKESRERVRTAIKNSGFMIPPKRITILIFSNLELIRLTCPSPFLAACGSIHTYVNGTD